MVQSLSIMKFRMIWIGPDEDPKKPRARTLGSSRQYVHWGNGIARKHIQHGREKLTPVANFSARIVRDLILEQDAESRRDFGIEAELDGEKLSFVVPASEFVGMGWVLRHLGPRAIIYPGQQQHARAAIQSFSGSLRQSRVFLRLGWTKRDNDWVYLQARRAIGAGGYRCDEEVQLPAALEHYQVLRPNDPDDLVSAVRSSLGLLSLAPDRISFPLLASVYRAPLGQVGFSLFLTGRSGSFKTALAALCQQHFGTEMDASHLPGNFTSTANALEILAHAAKDTLLVVDDFVPRGGSGDHHLQTIAERLFRSAGNHQGRSRMSGSGRLNTPQPSRALLLATGEEVPRGQSVRARLLIVEVRPGDIDRSTLSECQSAAQAGRFAVSMGAFVNWIASRYEYVQERLTTRVTEIRSQHHGYAVHARLPSAVADLRAGWEIFLDFAFEAGAISRLEQAELKDRWERALDELAAVQTRYHQVSDPALRFISLLQAALLSGRAHMSDRLGKTPKSPSSWGWRRSQSGRGWAAQGTRIGWVAEADAFLEPTISYQVAQDLAGSERILVGEQTLRHRLREGGLLASVDVGRQMLMVRRTLEGSPRQVLHLKAGCLQK